VPVFTLTDDEIIRLVSWGLSAREDVGFEPEETLVARRQVSPLLKCVCGRVFEPAPVCRVVIGSRRVCCIA